MERTSGEAAGAAFKRLRELSGLSIRQLADAAGVWPTSVCRVERGGPVSGDTRDRLVSVLGPKAKPLIALATERTPEPDTAVYRARMTRGESGREVARRAGVSKDVYYRAELGQPVHIAHVKAIADALGLDIDDVKAERAAA